ncbi:hypothetical protein SDC9_75945 [bioreactor metagenome]|uniref:Uncharacterized protein n=1 Tax=bioreactor metagenome TaxID=1076179 RepID=A0A644YLD9_9ZZZZ
MTVEPLFSIPSILSFIVNEFDGNVIVAVQVAPFAQMLTYTTGILCVLIL